MPVVPVDAAGFYGTKNLGNRLAGEAMFKYVIGTRRAGARPRRAPMACRRYDVNLIGEYNIAGEFWHVAPLFDELGLRILCTLSGDARFREVQTMHRAEVEHGGLRQGAAQRGAQDAGQLRHALLRRQFLRCRRMSRKRCATSPG